MSLTLFIYNSVLVAAIFLLFPVWFVLFLIKPSWNQHILERFFGPRGSFDVWLHGASVGEVKAFEHFIECWHQKYPQAKFLVTCNTRTARDIALKSFSSCHVQLAPFDFTPIIWLWTFKCRVTCHVLSELDIWPAKQGWLAKRKIPTIVLGARMTPRGFERVKKFWCFMKEAYFSVTLWGVRDDTVEGYLKSLGISSERIVLTGPLKYDALIFSKEPEVQWGQRLADEKFIVAGSLHPGEETAFISLARDYQVAVVPRHPEKFSYFQEVFNNEKIPCVLWSSNEPFPDKGILLVDQMGLLSGIYAKAAVTFVGGTLVPIGGHNVLEPARFGCPIVVGPHTDHVAHELEILQGEQGIFQGETSQEIAHEVAQLMQNPDQAAEMGQGALESLKKMAGGTEKSIKMVESLLSKS